MSSNVAYMCPSGVAKQGTRPFSEHDLWVSYPMLCSKMDSCLLHKVSLYAPF